MARENHHPRGGTSQFSVETKAAIPGVEVPGYTLDDGSGPRQVEPLVAEALIVGGGMVEQACQSSERGHGVPAADYRVTKGVAKASVTLIGQGETFPRFPNDTDEHKAGNRRVVIQFQK